MNDVSLLSLEKQLLYDSYRDSINGYWAEVPRSMLNELPSGTKFSMPGHGLCVVIEINDLDLAFKSANEFSSGNIVKKIDELPQTLKCFIRDDVVEVNSLEGAFDPDLTSKLLVVWLMFLPYLGVTIYGYQILEFGIEAYLLYFFCALGLFVLVSAVIWNGNDKNNFLCKSASGETGCNGLFNINLFRVSMFNPLILGLTYFSTLPLILMSNLYTLESLVIVLSLFFVVFLYVLRWKRKYRCSVCEYTSKLTIASAIISALVVYGRSFEVNRNISVFELFLTCFVIGAYFFSVNFLCKKLDSFASKSMKLKAFQSRLKVFNSDIKNRNKSVLNNLRVIRKDRVFYDKEGRNDIHLIMSLKCVHCERIFLEIAEKLYLFDTRNFYVTIQYVPGVSLQREESLGEYSDCEKLASLKAYFNNKMSIKVEKLKMETHNVSLPYVPILTVNGHVFPTLYELEDLFVYLKYYDL